MKNNKIARIAFTAVLTLTMLAHMGIVRAEPPELVPEESEVDISFEEGNGGVSPVDPDDPSKPLNPDEPDEGGTGQSGALALNYISPITFGQQKISGVTETYNAETMKPFVQVTDLRGNITGWQVTASAAPFKSASGAASLEGSVITFERGEAKSANEELLPPTPSAFVELKTDGLHIANIVKADPGAGFGTWITRWYPSGQNKPGENDSVTLSVLPGTATPERHSTKITWTLAPNVTP